MFRTNRAAGETPPFETQPFEAQQFTRRRFVSRRFATTLAMTVSALMVTVLAVAVHAPSPAGAEISPNPSAAEGVAGFGSTQFTGPIDSHVYSIEQVGNRIFVGGNFTEAKTYLNDPAPVSQPYLAAFDLDTGALIESFTPAVDAPVYALQASPDGSRLFVGGEFTSINGEPYTEGLVALDPLTGEVDPTWNAYLENPWTTYPVVIKAIDMDDNYLYFGGNVTASNSPDAARTDLRHLGKAAISDGTVDPTFKPIVTGGSIWGLAVSPDGSRVHLGGYFNAVNGDPDTQWFTSVNSSDGSTVAGLTSFISQTAYPDRAYIHDIEVYGDKIWIGGSEHAIYQLDSTTNQILRTHSTRRGGDYQDIEIVGDRVYGSCHCYTDHYADYDYWVNRNNPVPAGVLVTPIKYVAAYGADSGDYIPSFQLNATATKAGVWAIHGDSNGCLWVGGDLSTAGDLAGGNEQWTGAFGRFCESQGGALPAPTGVNSPFQDKSRIVLNWSSVAGASEYEILRDGVVIGSDTGRWFTDLGTDLGGLSQGTEYTYVVRALTAVGDVGDPSVALAVSTTGTPPGAPLPAPEDVVSTFQDKTRIVLNYGSVSGADHYEILRDGVVLGTDTGVWFTDLDLPSGTSYDYQVRAVSADGTLGVLSAVVTASTTGTPPGAPLPAPEDVVSTFQDKTRIVLNYGSVSGADHYEILRDGVVLGTDTGVWFTDLDLPSGTSYDYQVRAVSADGTLGVLSAVVTASTTGTPPDAMLPAPAGFTSTFQDRSRIVLRFDHVDGADHYEVLRDGVSIGTLTGRWYTDLDLPAGSTYDYQVRAISVAGTPGDLTSPLTVSTNP